MGLKSVRSPIGLDRIQLQDWVWGGTLRFDAQRFWWGSKR